MHAHYRLLPFVLTALCVAPLVAQDVPLGASPYARKRQRPQERPAVDAALVRAVHDKIADCYEREQREALSKEDDALLRAYGAEVVRELEAGLSGTGCVLGARASERCLTAVADLDCAKLAEPIVAAGWDRNLTAEARTQVADYAGMLARREARCSGHEAEDAQVITGVRTDRLATLIESQIVIGQCQLFPERLPACAGELEHASCDRIMTLNERGELQQICKVLECTAPAQGKRQAK
jgi:hypothetical protein